MLRIRFTESDLTCVRLVDTVGPWVEAALAARLLTKPPTPPFRSWQRHMSSQLPGPVDMSEDVLLTEALATSREGGEAVRLKVNAITQHLSAINQAGIRPFWPAIRHRLALHREAWGRQQMRDGLSGMMSGLSPRVHWDWPNLIIQDHAEHEVALLGAGLRICPTLFLTSRTVRVYQINDEPPCLLVAVGVQDKSVEDLWVSGNWHNPTTSLGALLGRTRAAVLLALSSARSTSELARILDISPASVSQHTAVLRDAGLISTRRFRSNVRHDATPLGRVLMGGVGHG